MRIINFWLQCVTLLLVSLVSIIIIEGRVQPNVVIVGDKAHMSRTEKALICVNAPQNKLADLSRAVSYASQMTNISPELLVALIKTESEFDYYAISHKGFKGLMQTPWASHKWPDVDVLYGARILEEKLKRST